MQIIGDLLHTVRVGVENNDRHARLHAVREDLAVRDAAFDEDNLVGAVPVAGTSFPGRHTRVDERGVEQAQGVTVRSVPSASAFDDDDQLIRFAMDLVSHVPDNPGRNRPMPSDPAPSGAVPARTIFDSAKDDDRNRRLLNLIVSPTGIRECRLVSVAGDEGFELLVYRFLARRESDKGRMNLVVTSSKPGLWELIPGGGNRLTLPSSVIPGLDPGINTSTAPRSIPGSSPGMTLRPGDDVTARG